MKVSNWWKHCEKILETKQCCCDNNFRQELVNLIRYLQIKGHSKEEIEDLLKNHIRSKLWDLDEEDADIILQKCFKMALNSRMFNKPLKPIVYFQEEIDFINSLPVELWYRKYLLGLLFWFKKREKKTIPFSMKEGYAIIRVIGMGKIYKDRHIALHSEWRDRFNLFHTYEFRSHFKKSDISLTEIKDLPLLENGTPIDVKVYELEDIKLLFDYLSPSYKFCENCGQKFIVNANTKTCLCPKCYRSKEATRLKEYRKKLKNESVQGATSTHI